MEAYPDIRFHTAATFSFPYWKHCFAARDDSPDGFGSVVDWCQENFGRSADVRLERRKAHRSWAYCFVNRAVLIQEDTLAAAFKMRWF